MTNGTKVAAAPLSRRIKRGQKLSHRCCGNALRIKYNDAVVHRWSNFAALQASDSSRSALIHQEPANVIPAPLEREAPTSGMDERWYRAIIEHANDLIIVVNPDGSRRFVSPSVTRMLGYSMETYLKFEAFELIHPDDLGHVRAGHADCVAHIGPQHPFRYRVRHADAAGGYLRAPVRICSTTRSCRASSLQRATSPIPNARGVASLRARRNFARHSRSRRSAWRWSGSTGGGWK